MHLRLLKGKTANSYFKSMATLVSGSALAQLVVIVVAPITTRLFSPVEMGVYTLIVSAVNMFGMVLSLRYDLSIVYEEDEDNVYPLIVASGLICLAMSLAVAIGYWVYFTYVSHVDYPAFGACCFIFVLCLVFGLVNILNSFNNRLKEYGVMTKANVSRTVFQNSLIVITGLAKFGETGLLLAQTIGYCAGLSSQSKTLRGSIESIKRVTKADIRRVTRKHSRQALLSAPASFINGFSYTVITYFVEYLYGAFAVGLYSISFRVLGMPISVISSNICRIFTKEAATEKAMLGCFTQSFKKTLALLCVIAAPLGIVLIVVSPPLFGFVFGSEWYDAGVYVRVLTPMFMLRFIAGGLNGATMISGKQDIDLIIQVFLAIAVVASFLGALLLGFDICDFLSLMNLTASVVYVAYIFFFWRCSKCKEK